MGPRQLVVLIVLAGYGYCHSKMPFMPEKFDDPLYALYFAFTVICVVIILQLTSKD